MPRLGRIIWRVSVMPRVCVDGTERSTEFPLSRLATGGVFSVGNCRIGGTDRTLRYPDHMEYEVDTEPPKAVQVAAYFVVCKAVTYAVNHSGARRIEIAVRQTASELKLQLLVAEGFRAALTVERAAQAPDFSPGLAAPARQGGRACCLMIASDAPPGGCSASTTDTQSSIPRWSGSSFGGRSR